MGDRTTKSLGKGGDAGGHTAGTGLYDFMKNDQIEIVTKPGTATTAPERLKMRLAGRDNGQFVFEVTPENADILARVLPAADAAAIKRKLASGGPVYMTMSPDELQRAARDNTLVRNHGGKRWNVDPEAKQAMTMKEGRPFKNMAQGGTGANRRGQEQQTPYNPQRKTQEPRETPIKSPQKPRIRNVTEEAAAKLPAAMRKVQKQQAHQRNVRHVEARKDQQARQRDYAVRQAKQEKQQAQRDRKNARWRAERAEARIAIEKAQRQAVLREKKNVKRNVSTKSDAARIAEVERRAAASAARIAAKKSAAKQARVEQRAAEKRIQQAREKEAKAKKGQV